MGRTASEYAWAIWLAAPLLVTIVAALGFWWRGRNRSGPSVRAAISDHHRYLDTLELSTAARGDRLWTPPVPGAGRDESADPSEALNALAPDRPALPPPAEASTPKSLDVAS